MVAEGEAREVVCHRAFCGAIRGGVRADLAEIMKPHPHNQALQVMNYQKAVGERIMNETTVTCRLHAILSERGLRPSDLWRKYGLSGTNFNLIISGHRLPRPELAKQIAASLSLSVADIWPDYEAVIVHRRAKQREAVAAYHSHQQQKTDMQKVSPGNSNAVPLADGSNASEFALHPAAASDDLLQDHRWCRTHAKRMHDYLVRNCAYGVYLELRRLMAAENRLFEERSAVVARRGPEEISL